MTFLGLNGSVLCLDHLETGLMLIPTLGKSPLGIALPIDHPCLNPTNPS